MELFSFVISDGFCIDCFLDILKSHQWNFIKPCKQNPIFKTNTYNENLRARGHVLAITVRGVSNKHCLLPFFHFPWKGAPIAQLGECQTLDRKVPGSILTWGTVLCP